MRRAHDGCPRSVQPLYRSGQPWHGQQRSANWNLPVGLLPEQRLRERGIRAAPCHLPKLKTAWLDCNGEMVMELSRPAEWTHDATRTLKPKPVRSFLLSPGFFPGVHSDFAAFSCSRGDRL